MKIFYREGNHFKIDKNQLSEKSNNTQVINALYTAAYNEFKGAVKNPLYKHLSNKEKMSKLNEFAENWLNSKGLM